MWQRFTERARKVIFYAQEEAGRLGENYVSTEHLLLGLVRESDSMASRVLDRMGVSLGRIRSEVERQVARGDGRLGQDMQLTPRAKKVIDLAYDEARQLNNNYIGTEHLLLGLIREGDGLAGKVLLKLGVDLDLARLEVQFLRGSRTEQTAAPQDEADAQNAGLEQNVRLERLARRILHDVTQYFSEQPAAANQELNEMLAHTETLPETQAALEIAPEPEPQAPMPASVPGNASQRMAPPTRERSDLYDILGESRLRGRDILGIEPLTQEEILLILDVAMRLKRH